MLKFAQKYKYILKAQFKHFVCKKKFSYSRATIMLSIEFCYKVADFSFYSACLELHVDYKLYLFCVIFFRYKKDIDGFLKVNMVRFETVEVTKEIMKNMAKKPPNLRQSQRKRTAVTPESGRSSPGGSSSPSSSSSSSYSSDLSGGEDLSSQHSPRGADSPVYCVMSSIPHGEDDSGGPPQEDCDDGGTSGAVQALTEVARGLGMDVVWMLSSCSLILQC